MPISSQLFSVGYITVVEEKGYITNIYFGKEDNNNKSELTEITLTQLWEYFAGKRKVFDLPLMPQGTEFQKKVWDALLKIPYGETMCYKDIANLIKNPKASRAVGMANNKNPIAIVIPCHRVIGKNGKLTGYAGGLDIKEKLLLMEQKHLDNTNCI